MLVVDFFLYQYWSMSDYPKEFVDYVCSGIFFIGVGIQVSLDWFFNKELRLLNYFQAIKTAEDKLLSIFAIGISFSFGGGLVVKGILVLS